LITFYMHGLCGSAAASTVLTATGRR